MIESKISPITSAPRPFKRLTKVLLSLALLALSLYALVILGIWWKQEKLLFAPTVLAQDHKFNVAPDVAERLIDVEGARLSALHLQLPNPKAVVFYLHGNAGSLDSWFVNTDFYRSMNVDLLMIDYRGYGKSTGSITSEQQLHNDAAASFLWLRAQYPKLPLVLIGRSLGTGPASRLYASLPRQQRPELMILVSPFLSLKELAAKHFPLVPTTLLRYPMRSDSALSAIEPKSFGIDDERRAVLLLHGDQDQLIPVEHSQGLSALHPQIELKVIRGAAHNDLQDFPEYLEAIKQAVARAAP